MSYIKQKKYANTVLGICKMFSAYYQKKLLLSIYNNQKSKKKCKKTIKMYENWLLVHNINY